MMNSTIQKKSLYKDLTIQELKRGEKKKYFFMKNGDFIFPMNGKFGIAISGLFDGENIPFLDEIRIAHLLKLLGKDGWIKCYPKN